MANTLDMQAIFREDIPLIDVRAPVEFDAGAFSQASNLPILNDTQREQVGICYSASGPEAATRMGHEECWSSQMVHPLYSTCIYTYAPGPLGATRLRP